MLLVGVHDEEEVGHGGANSLQPNTKLIKNLEEEKYEFSSENMDLGVFDIAEFKFWGPESKFDRN